MTSSDLCDRNQLPKAVAIIMDGNRRWALRRGLSSEVGHAEGARVAEEIMRYAYELGISYLTLFAFSSENWQRSSKEISGIMRIIDHYLNHDEKELLEKNIKISTIGDTERLPFHVRNKLKKLIKKTEKCSKFHLTLALSYGSWEEVSEACKAIAHKVKNGLLTTDEITPTLLNEHLFTSDMPHPDLFIRTSGELRLSNFLLMQISYSELYFTPKLWPDFSRRDFDEALASFKSRTRRFGADNKE